MKIEAVKSPSVSTLVKPSVIVKKRYIMLRSAPASNTVKPASTSARFRLRGTTRMIVLIATKMR